MLSLAPFSFIALCALIVCLISSQSRKRALLLLSMALLWGLYVVIVGGDLFPAWRQFVPLIVIFTFAIIEGFRLGYIYIQERSPSNLPSLIFSSVILIPVLFVIYTHVQFTNPVNGRAIVEQWEWDGQVVGLLLKKAFANQQPLIAVTAGGCLPYWSELPALDMLGVNDYYLPRHRPKDIGEGDLGHELGNGRYVLDSKPDIIIFHTGFLGDVFRSGQEMQRTKEFFESYTPIRCRGMIPYEYLAVLWFRKYSDKIGVSQGSQEIRVPGYMLNANPDSFAYLNGNGELVVPIVSGLSVGIEIPIPTPQDWKCEVKASDPVSIHCHLTSDGIALDTNSTKPIEIEEVILKKIKSSL
jgi:hypothetical protein